MGQPNFMEKGSCCGKWGLSRGQESCPRSPSCELCYNTSFGEGYRAYFNQAEFDFARAVGSFWTNLGASGDPNQRQEPRPVADTAIRWPAAGNGGIVLSAGIPGGSRIERELYDDPRVCELWDAFDRGH